MQQRKACRLALPNSTEPGVKGLSTVPHRYHYTVYCTTAWESGVGWESPHINPIGVFGFQNSADIDRQFSAFSLVAWLTTTGYTAQDGMSLLTEVTNAFLSMASRVVLPMRPSGRPDCHRPWHIGCNQTLLGATSVGSPEGGLFLQIRCPWGLGFKRLSQVIIVCCSHQFGSATLIGRCFSESFNITIRAR